MTKDIKTTSTVPSDANWESELYKHFENTRMTYSSLPIIDGLPNKLFISPAKELNFKILIDNEIKYNVTRVQSLLQSIFTALFFIIAIHYAVKNLFLTHVIKNDWLENEI